MIDYLVGLPVFQQFLTATYYLQGRNGDTGIENRLLNTEKEGESETVGKKSGLSQLLR